MLQDVEPSSSHAWSAGACPDSFFIFTVDQKPIIDRDRDRFQTEMDRERGTRQLEAGGAGRDLLNS